MAAAFAVTPVAAGVVMFIIDVGLSYSDIHVFNGTPHDPVDAAIGLALGVTIIGFGRGQGSFHLDKSSSFARNASAKRLIPRRSAR
jgi:hypothetical protein